MEYKLNGVFKGKIKELNTDEKNKGDASAVKIELGNAIGGDYSAVRTYKGNATGGNYSAVETHEGDATGNDYSAVKTEKGNATGGSHSVVRTAEGDAFGGDGSVVMGSGIIAIGRNSVGVRVNEQGEIIKIIVNCDTSVDLRVELSDKLVDEV